MGLLGKSSSFVPCFELQLKLTRALRSNGNIHGTLLPGGQTVRECELGATFQINAVGDDRLDFNISQVVFAQIFQRNGIQQSGSFFRTGRSCNHQGQIHAQRSNGSRLHFRWFQFGVGVFRNGLNGFRFNRFVCLQLSRVICNIGFSDKGRLRDFVIFNLAGQIDIRVRSFLLLFHTDELRGFCFGIDHGTDQSATIFAPRNGEANLIFFRGCKAFERVQQTGHLTLLFFEHRLWLQLTDLKFLRHRYGQCRSPCRITALIVNLHNNAMGQIRRFLCLNLDLQFGRSSHNQRCLNRLDRLALTGRFRGSHFNLRNRNLKTFVIFRGLRVREWRLFAVLGSLCAGSFNQLDHSGRPLGFWSTGNRRTRPNDYGWHQRLGTDIFNGRTLWTGDNRNVVREAPCRWHQDETSNEATYFHRATHMTNLFYHSSLSHWHPAGPSRTEFGIRRQVHRIPAVGNPASAVTTTDAGRSPIPFRPYPIGKLPKSRLIRRIKRV